jgi:hypothetical protein
MQNLKDRNNWEELLKEFSAPGAANFLSKGPFSDLRAWAEGQQKAAQQAAIAKQRALDTDLATLCRQLGESEPPWLNPPIPKTVKRITYDLSIQEIEQFKAAIDTLERGYRENGWSKQNNRDQYISKLRKNLNNR